MDEPSDDGREACRELLPRSDNDCKREKNDKLIEFTAAIQKRNETKIEYNRNRKKVMGRDGMRKNGQEKNRTFFFFRKGYILGTVTIKQKLMIKNYG